MMGFTLKNAQVPVIKTTNCILAATAIELAQPQPEQPCIRCGMCEQVCPANLLPQQLLWFVKSREFDKAQHYNLLDCIECGACSYVCPSHIPLVQYYRHGKSEVISAHQTNIKSQQAKQRFEARKIRKKKELEARQAKRRARTNVFANKESKETTPAIVTMTDTTDPHTIPTAGSMDKNHKRNQTDLAITRAAIKKIHSAIKQAQAMDAPQLQALRQQLQAALERVDKLESNLDTNHQCADTPQNKKQEQSE